MKLKKKWQIQLFKRFTDVYNLYVNGYPQVNKNPIYD